MLGDSLRRRHGKPDREVEKKPRRPSQPPRKRRGSRFGWGSWLIAAVVVLAGSFGVGYLLSTQVLFPRPETAGMGIIVPALYGDTRVEAESAIRDAGLEVGTVAEMASMETEPGRVLAQDPVPGQQLRRGAAVSFAVSAGPPELRVPPLHGMGVRSARDLLEAVGFQVEIRQLRTDDAPDGVVVRTNPAPGDSQRLPAIVTLFVATAPGQDSVGAGVDPVGDAAGAPGRRGGAVR